MLRADRRVVVSHVGSLVRPPAMIPYLEKIRGDGEHGKSVNWAFYVHRRLSVADGPAVHAGPLIS
jgi:hypothetical protein